MMEFVYIFFLVSGVLKTFLQGFRIDLPIDITLISALVLITLTVLNIKKRAQSFGKVLVIDVVKQNWAVLLLFLWILISFTYSSSESYKFHKLLGSLTNLVAFLVPFWNKDVDVRKLFKWGILFLFCATLIFFFTHPVVLYLYGKRAQYPWMDFDAFSAVYLSLGEFLGMTILGLMFVDLKWNRLLTYGLLNYFILMLFYSGSRGPILIMLLIAIAGIIVKYIRGIHWREKNEKLGRQFWLKLMAVLLLVNTGFIGFVISDNKKMLVCERSFNRLGLIVNLVDEEEGQKIQEYVNEFDFSDFDENEMDYSSVEGDEKSLNRNKSVVARMIHYKFCKDKILHNTKRFFIGYGFGSYAFEMMGKDKRGYPHNTILELWFELGLIGVVLFALVFRRFILYPINHKSIGILLILLFCFLNSMKSSSFQDIRVLFGVAGLALFATRFRAKEKSICHISTVHRGKDTRIFFKECRSMVKEGFETELIITGSQNEIGDTEGVDFTLLRPNNSLVRRMLNSFVLGPFHALKSNARIYHLHDPELIPFGLVAKFFGAKVVFDFHELVYLQIKDKKFPGGKLSNYLARKIYLCFEWLAVCTFDGLVLAEKGYEDYFHKGYPNQKHKLFLIQNFPLLDIIDASNNAEVSAADKEEFVIFYAGGITRIRGIKEVVEAANKLEHIRFVILGKWDEDKYWEECLEVDKKGVIDYRGFVPMNEVYPILNKADLGISCLYPLENYLTSLPVKVFEYMACKAPILMSDFPYWKEVFSDCALFANPHDIDEIAMRINELKEDEAKRKSLALKGRERVENEFCWDEEKKKLLNLYESI